MNTATHRDAQRLTRYYRVNTWIGHVEVLNLDGDQKWRYFSDKLPETAVEIKERL